MDWVKKLGIIAILSATSVCTAANNAIMGGTSNINDSYAGLIDSESTDDPIPATNIPIPVGTGGEILSVAINASGASIIGGGTGFNASYVKLVDSSGVPSDIEGDLPSGNGSINGVAINDSGVAVIGGTQNNGIDPYIALVVPNVPPDTGGVATALTGPGIPPSNTRILSVAINSSGAGIFGTESGDPTYSGAIFSPDGVTTLFSGPAAPMMGERIFSVAINDSGVGIIGGDENTDLGSLLGTPYAVLISSSGVRTALSGPDAPEGEGHILSVAINSSGNAIIGGSQNGFRSPYAALVSSPSGFRTAISLPAEEFLNIYGVGINSSGTSIIGGSNFHTVEGYAAFVDPSGMTHPISLPDSLRLAGIGAVAISDAGIAILQGGGGLAALVSPQGDVTMITSDAQFISSVAINIPGSPPPPPPPPIPILDGLIPKSYGPGNSYVNSLFILTADVLPNHFMPHYLLRSTDLNRRKPALLADASEVAWKSPLEEDLKEEWPYCLTPEPNYSIWTAGFGDRVYQKQVDHFPTMRSWVAGALLAFDYVGIEDVVIGTGASYAFNHVHYGSGGHAKTNQEFLTCYAMRSWEHFFINSALWGGAYQMDNKRESSIANIVSTSNVDGWLFSPHLEFGIPFNSRDKKFIAAPFAMFDWANNWQGDVQEEGSAGFNIRFGSEYVSLLRSEVGIRFYEHFQGEWGDLILEEKGSWVNKKHFGTATTSTAFIGAASSFSVETFSPVTQNLVGLQFNLMCIPSNIRYPYGAINYQGEFSVSFHDRKVELCSAFKSNLISVEIGKYF